MPSRPAADAAARDTLRSRPRTRSTTRASESSLDLLAAGAELRDDGSEPELVDAAHAARADADRDPALLVFEPEALVLEVDLEATLRVTVRVAHVRAHERLLSGYLASARHRTSPRSSTL